jgi:hypothetical protein
MLGACDGGIILMNKLLKKFVLFGEIFYLTA